MTDRVTRELPIVETLLDLVENDPEGYYPKGSQTLSGVVTQEIDDYGYTYDVRRDQSQDCR